MNERFYLLKIQLLNIDPAIWRHFVVPTNITLDRLHNVIQIVMGWTDSHLHEFTIGNKCYTEYPESVNWELMKYLRWSRDRHQNWGGVE